MGFAEELGIMIDVLEKIPGEKLSTFRDREMCKHYDEIYKEVKSAPERLKLNRTSYGDFYASGAELLTKVRALFALLKEDPDLAQGK